MYVPSGCESAYSWAVRAALLVESLTGNTWKAAELIAGGLSQQGWSITGLSRVKEPDHASIQDADLVLVGTWVHGLFVVGQWPWAKSNIANLPAMRGKRAAVFCTFALNPGKSVDTLSDAVNATGANVIGGVALHRRQLEAHSEEFCARLLGAVQTA
jgi:flavodoxin